MYNIFDLSYEDVISRAIGHDTDLSYEDSDFLEDNLQESILRLMNVGEEMNSYENALIVLEAAKKIKIAQKGLKGKKKLKKKKKVTREGYIVEVEGDIDGIEGIDYEIEYEDHEISNIVSLEGEIWNKIKEGISKLIEAIVKFIESIINFLSGGGFKSNQALAKSILSKMNTFNGDRLKNKPIRIRKYFNFQNIFTDALSNIDKMISEINSNQIKFIDEQLSESDKGKAADTGMVTKIQKEAEELMDKYIKVLFDIESEERFTIAEDTLSPRTVINAANFILKTDDIKRSFNELKNTLKKINTKIKDKMSSSDTVTSTLAKVLNEIAQAIRKSVANVWNAYKIISVDALKIIREASRATKKED